MSMGLVLLGMLPQTSLSQEPVVAYSTLTAPGAGTKFGQGTFALSINDGGVISGFYVNSGSFNDSTAVYHGFVRDGRLVIQNNGIVSVQAESTFSNAQCFTSLDGASFVQ